MAWLFNILQTFVVSQPVVPPKEDPRERRFRSAADDEAHELADLKSSPAEVDLSVIIPAFNEILRLPTMLDQALSHLSKPTAKKRVCEIVIVDDGSDDGTAEVALEYARKHADWDIRIVSLVRNLGKGGAVRHGMLHGRGRRLLMVDADGASRFDDLELLWDEMDKLEPAHPSSVVIGSRAHLVNTEAVVKVRTFACAAYCFGYILHTALPFAQLGDARTTLDTSPCRCWSYPGHPVWVQALYERSGETYFPLPASERVDL